jgi:hypothetical protein
MANASDYLEQAVYNHIFRGATFSKPSTIAIGLTLNVPTDAGTYTEVANAGGYARYPNASGDAVWSAMTAPGSGTNSIEFAFPQATADWGTVSGVIITDSASHNGGNVLMHGTLVTPRNVQNGDTFKFSAGSIDVSIQ